MISAMRLSQESLDLLKLQHSKLADDVFHRNRQELYKYKLEAPRSGGACLALDKLYAILIAEIVEAKVEQYLSAFGREGLIPTDDEIQEIVTDLSGSAHTLWRRDGHQPLPSSPDEFQSIVPRARLSLIVAVKEMRRNAARDHGSPISPGQLPTQQVSTDVHQTRLEELKSVRSSAFDLARLIALCEEINVSAAAGANHAIAMLVRAIMDHVPPIFGMSSFAQVASNYGGSKSFKEAMQSLETAARKISDAHLHTQIRQSEILPTATQVNFSAQLDFLLSEIVRLLK
jgi:hypothetical protein